MSDSGSFTFSTSPLSSSSSSFVPVSGSFCAGVDTSRCQRRLIKLKSVKNRSKQCLSEPPTFNTPNYAISSTTTPKPLSTTPFPASSLSAPSVSNTPSSLNPAMLFPNSTTTSSLFSSSTSQFSFPTPSTPTLKRIYAQTTTSPAFSSSTKTVTTPVFVTKLSDTSDTTSESPSSILTHVAPVSTSMGSSSEHQTISLLEKGNYKLRSYSHLPLTVVWKILKGIPQNPHFLELRSYSELVRKNLISGWDRTFEETVEQIHALRAVDFWARASELWKTLEELQSLGYNVLLLRKRLVELTDVMMELKSSRCKILGLKNKAESHRMEKNRVESEILKLQAQVEREQIGMEEALNQVVKMENDLPKFDGVFANLAMKPL